MDGLPILYSLENLNEENLSWPQRIKLLNEYLNINLIKL